MPAFQAWLYAEDPAADYQPQIGLLTRFETFPTMQQGATASASTPASSPAARSPRTTTPCLAKVIAYALTREQAAR